MNQTAINAHELGPVPSDYPLLIYHASFETSRAPKLLIDPGSGAIIDANSAACLFYGYDRMTIRTLDIWDINILGEAGTRQKMEAAIRGDQTTFEFQHRLASGEIRDVEVFSGPIVTPTGSC